MSDEQPGLKWMERYAEMRSNQRLYVFLICLFIATAFWFLNAFTKDYDTVVDVPIRYINFPKDKILHNKLPETLGINVEAFGFDLLAVNLGRSLDTVEVDCRSLKLQRSGAREYAYYSTRMLREEIAKRLNSEIKVQGIVQDSIAFIMEPRLVSVVPVRHQVTVEMEKQYILDGIVETRPARVKVSGPKSMIDTLRVIRTEVRAYTDTKERVEEMVPLILPGEPGVLITEPASVQVIVPVDRFTEGTIELPIEIYNLPDSLEMNLYPDKYKVVYQVALNKYDKVSADDFKVSVDYHEIVGGSATTLKVHLEAYPSFVHPVLQTPEKVEYILKK